MSTLPTFARFRDTLTAHSIDQNTHECSCGVTFPYLRDHQIHVAFQMDMTASEQTTDHIASTIAEHSYGSDSVASRHICECGTECLDSDLIRHMWDALTDHAAYGV